MNSGRWKRYGVVAIFTIVYVIAVPVLFGFISDQCAWVDTHHVTHYALLTRDCWAQ